MPGFEGKTRHFRIATLKCLRPERRRQELISLRAAGVNVRFFGEQLIPPLRQIQTSLEITIEPIRIGGPPRGPLQPPPDFSAKPDLRRAAMRHDVSADFHYCAAES